MKKNIALFLALALLLGLAGCSSGGDRNTSPSGQSGQNTQSALDTRPTQPTQPDQNTADFQEVTAVDDDNCTIRITGMDPENTSGCSLSLFLENKSQDTTYMFSVSSAAINGVQADPFFATEVAPGKKANETVQFPKDFSNGEDVGRYNHIELTFRVYDSKDLSAKPVAEPTVNLYPYGEESATPYTREPEDDDTILVDNEYATVILTGYEEDDIWGYTAELYLVNKSQTPAMFTVEDVSVNGYMADPLYAASVSPGKCAFSAMSWSDKSLSDAGVTEVETIEFTLRIYNADDWSAEDYVNQKVTLSP